jgi:5,5'-dehydrodivanillate O-demethylase
MDNSHDPIHFEHLHGHYQNYYNSRHDLPGRLNAAAHVKLEFDLFEYGIYKRRFVEGDDPENPPDDWTTGHPTFFPNTLIVGAGDGFGYQIRIPVDDTNTLHLYYSGRPRKDDELPQEIVPVRRSEVHYNKFGLVEEPGIVPQDEMTWIGQGPISNRTAEHLATSDKGIILYHKLILDNIEKVERGEDPMGIVRDPAKNEPWIEVKREKVAWGAFNFQGSRA